MLGGYRALGRRHTIQMIAAYATPRTPRYRQKYPKETLNVPGTSSTPRGWARKRYGYHPDVRTRHMPVRPGCRPSLYNVTTNVSAIEVRMPFNPLNAIKERKAKRAAAAPHFLHKYASAGVTPAGGSAAPEWPPRPCRKAAETYRFSKTGRLALRNGSFCKPKRPVSGFKTACFATH